VRPFARTISLGEARKILDGALVPIDRTVTLPLADAHDRVLAADLIAGFDVPPFDRSAMDGYAVRADDTRGATPATPKALHVVGRAYTAEPFRGTLDAGQAVEIATGAPLPASADAVVMVEETAAPGSGDWPSPAWLDSSDTRLVLAEVRSGQHIVRRGADMRAREPVLGRGAHLNASRFGAVAALGIDPVDVYDRPLVAILPTGNEVVAAGEPLPEASVYDVNSYTLASVVTRHGGEAVRLPPVDDTLAEVLDALDGTRNLTRADGRSAAADIVVLAGGSSVGERDVIIDALVDRGEVLFHGIAVKPGKPTALATLGSQLVFGMPGNPTSCLSNAHVLLVPALRAIARLPPHRPERLRCRLATDVSSVRGRHQFLPVRVEGTDAIPTFKGSGEITSLSNADGYMEIAEDVERVEAGTEVTVTLY
jgi:molybdenum cofactor synthesis domain-containing protein